MWNGSAYYESLKGAGAAPTRKPGLARRGLLLLLDIFRAWKEVFLAAFLVFPKELAALPLQQPPAFWERSLRAGSNCCLSKAVLLCGGVIIIPHLAFLMKVLVSVVPGCKDVHKAKFPCLCLQWSLAPVWACVLGSQVGSSGTCSLELGTLWLFALQHHYKQTCRETAPVILCSWRLLCCAEKHAGHQLRERKLLRMGGSCRELQPDAPDGGFISCWSHHFHPQSFSWQPGELF